MSALLTVQGLSQHYRSSSGALIRVLENLQFEVEAGQQVVLTGVSGSGKSTLLHLLAGLEQPTAGQCLWLGQPPDLNFRRQSLGFVYQFHHLMPELNAAENVALPLLLAGEKAPLAHQRALDLLEHIGLSARAEAMPATLSGGEKQRVAVARALIHRPLAVLADEPTGSLDRALADEVFALLLHCQRQFGSALIVVTHDERLARQADQWWHLEGGTMSRKGNAE